MNHLRFSLIAAIVGTLSACAASPTKLESLTAKSPYVVSMDATRRAIDVLPRTDGKGVIVCAEPSPDVALSISSQLMASVAAQNPNISASLQAQLNESVVQLAGRSQTILFLRESLYRLCEQSINEKLTADQTMELYRSAMQTALVLANADLTKAKADLAQAPGQSGGQAGNSSTPAKTN